MLKRLFDITVATFALVVLAPIMLLLMLAIRLDSAGPAMFRQTRVGRHGREFQIHKFRTMVASDVSHGPWLTAGDDARITSLGRWLRAHRLDELPQLMDVLTGHMSMVGPRPEVPHYVAQVPAATREAWLAVRPGMTDPASLAHLDEAALLAHTRDPEAEYVARVLPRKIAMSIQYAERATLRSDAAVLWATVRRLVTL